MGLLIQAALMGGGELDYKQAYKLHQETGRPMVVLVGTDWCPGCQTMKQSTMPEVERRGKLGKVHYSVINSDDDKVLAKELLEGNMIPQLIFFRETPSGWVRSRVIGPKSPEEVEEFIQKGLDAPSFELTSHVKVTH
jgi:thioredoxin-like negative regulator of GroEL